MSAPRSPRNHASSQLQALGSKRKAAAPGQQAAAAGHVEHPSRNVMKRQKKQAEREAAAGHAAANADADACGAPAGDASSDGDISETSVACSSPLQQAHGDCERRKLRETPEAQARHQARLEAAAVAQQTSLIDAAVAKNDRKKQAAAVIATAEAQEAATKKVAHDASLAKAVRKELKAQKADAAPASSSSSSDSDSSGSSSSSSSSSSSDSNSDSSSDDEKASKTKKKGSKPASAREKKATAAALTRVMAKKKKVPKKVRRAYRAQVIAKGANISATREAVSRFVYATAFTMAAAYAKESTPSQAAEHGIRMLMAYPVALEAFDANAAAPLADRLAALHKTLADKAKKLSKRAKSTMKKMLPGVARAATKDTAATSTQQQQPNRGATYAQQQIAKGVADGLANVAQQAEISALRATVAGQQLGQQHQAAQQQQQQQQQQAASQFMGPPKMFGPHAPGSFPPVGTRPRAGTTCYVCNSDEHIARHCPSAKREATAAQVANTHTHTTHTTHERSACRSRHENTAQRGGSADLGPISLSRAYDGTPPTGSCTEPRGHAVTVRAPPLSTPLYLPLSTT